MPTAGPDSYHVVNSDTWACAALSLMFSPVPRLSNRNQERMRVRRGNRVTSSVCRGTLAVGRGHIEYTLKISTEYSLYDTTTGLPGFSSSCLLTRRALKDPGVRSSINNRQAMIITVTNAITAIPISVQASHDGMLG